jgi:hypothetical protein
MRVALAAVLALFSFAAAIAGCAYCSVNCADGYEKNPGNCSCRPIRDGGADAIAASDGGSDAASDAALLASCLPGSACGAGSTCIDGCPASRLPANTTAGGVCSVAGRDTCGCGGVLDPCDTPGTVCLMPACCDFQGVCVTPAERAAICARPEGVHFDCADAAP